jgi:hypothetical protein
MHRLAGQEPSRKDKAHQPLHKYLKLPTPVVINLCVKMAQKYCSDDSYKFINGVLDKFKD